MTLAFGTVLLTGYYMTRQVIFVFLGEARFKPSKGSKQLPIGMTISLIFLAIGATWLLFSPNPMDPTSSWPMTLFISDFEQAIPNNIHSMVFKIALLLSLLGIGLGYMKFRKYNETNSSAGLISVVNQISTNNWYLDQIYYVTFVNAILKLSAFARVVEVHLIDRIVNYIGVFQVILSRVIGWGDKHVVDGIVHLITSGVHGVGKIARSAQGDNAQRYIMTALISIIFIAGGIDFYFLKY
jgi:NADH-quinone oxidoreductase subunit L